MGIRFFKRRVVGPTGQGSPALGVASGRFDPAERWLSDVSLAVWPEGGLGLDCVTIR